MVLRDFESSFLYLAFKRDLSFEYWGVVKIIWAHFTGNDVSFVASGSKLPEISDFLDYILFSGCLPEANSLFTTRLLRMPTPCISRPMIYEYDDSIHFLKSALKQRAEKNSGYSMRAFAKKLGLSAGGLSLILNRKKKLSVDRAYEVAQALELDAEASEYFTTLVQLEGAKSDALRIQFLDKVRALNPNINASKDLKQSILSLEHFKLISDWYGLAVLELVSNAEGNWTSKNISKKLGLHKIDVEIVLERLLKLELIEEIEEGAFVRVVDSLMIESQVPNEAIRKYYQGVHAQSLKSLEEQTPAEKVIGAQVFAFDPTQIEEVRKLTDEYLKKLNSLAAEGKNRTEVYQAITNVFRIGHKELV